MNAPAPIDGFAALASRYDALLCDIWGVVHDGVTAHGGARDALERFRAEGGTVVLITNAPRPSSVVKRQLAKLKVTPAAYDAVVASGDVTRAVVAARLQDAVFHLGPERDRAIFEGLDVRFAPLEAADYVVCSGLFDDETETPDDYRGMLAAMRARNLLMVCANPDVVVDRGTDRLYCAGALADAYAALGGAVLHAGKPHPPIYAQAMEQIAALRGTPVPIRRVLAIGDSVRTDFTGALTLGADFLFVTSGIHADAAGGGPADPAVLAPLFAAAGRMPHAVTHRLQW